MMMRSLARGMNEERSNGYESTCMGHDDGGCGGVECSDGGCVGVECSDGGCVGVECSDGGCVGVECSDGGFVGVECSDGGCVGVESVMVGVWGLSGMVGYINKIFCMSTLYCCGDSRIK